MEKSDVSRVRVLKVTGRSTEIAVARVLGIPLREAVVFLKHVPAELPLNLSREDAEAIAQDVGRDGSQVDVRDVTHASVITCQTHPRLCNDGQCKGCHSWVCGVCRSQSPQGLCPQCARRSQRSESFRWLRIGILLVILMGVLGLAWRDHLQSEARLAWERPLGVRLILIEEGDGLDAEVVAQLKSRVPFLEKTLTAQYQGWGRTGSPFKISVVGPVTGPFVPTLNENGWWARVGFTRDLHVFENTIEETLGQPGDSVDIRIYMVLRAPTGRLRNFEGVAAQGGSVGLVEIDLAEDMVDLALITATHEFFHTLGATDKYTADGENLIPEGLADPEKTPVFPQEALEIMARHVSISPDESRLPRSLSEIRVNAYTANEIGWLKKEMK